MAFSYAAAVPDRCICRWVERPIDALPEGAIIDGGPDTLVQLLHQGVSVQMRISESAGCPFHEPARPFPVAVCGSIRCKARIIWAITDRRRHMPVDADPTPEGNVGLRWIPGSNDILATVLTVAQTRERLLLQGRLHLSHFVVCPDAERYRTAR